MPKELTDQQKVAIRELLWELNDLGQFQPTMEELGYKDPRKSKDKNDENRDHRSK